MSIAIDSSTAAIAMTTTPMPSTIPLAAKAVLSVLEKLDHGRLELTTPEAERLYFGQPQHHDVAKITVYDWQVFSMAIRSGDIGFAEAYRDGLWTSPDPTALLRLFIKNRQSLEQTIYGSFWGSLLYRVKHLLQRNTRRGSSKNIHAHYDIGNAFYRLWLDEGMNYSSAWFADDKMNLAEAQVAKTKRALTECNTKLGDKVLEIGCGWGALAEIAVRDYGLRHEGITLSTEQLDYAQKRLSGLNGGEKSQLVLRDYRDYLSSAYKGTFDAVVSIEMFEAVGESYWPSYFATLKNALKPGGRACVQTITIDDALFERYRVGTDFIQQYIFPGGMLPCDRVFRAQAKKAGLKVINTFAFGQDYARTLSLWRKEVYAHDAVIRGQGFDDAFMKIWAFYLCYCEAAFSETNTNVVQYTLVHDHE